MPLFNPGLYYDPSSPYYDPNRTLVGLRGPTSLAQPAGQSARRRAASRVARGSFAQRGAGSSLSDALRSGLMPAGLGGERGPGMTLADVLRSGASPVSAPQVTPPAPQIASGSPFADVSDDMAGLMSPIASLQNKDQAFARDLARQVEAGTMSLGEAAARYREYRFGGL